MALVVSKQKYPESNIITLEHYKPIPNYSQYLISEHGDIWDIKQDKYLSWISNGGYACVNLYRDDGKKILEKVHRCIAYAYLPKPEGSTNTLLHIDLNRTNNVLSNLRWKIKGKSDTSHVRFHTLSVQNYICINLKNCIIRLRR